MAHGTYTTTSNMLNAYYVPGTVLNFFIFLIDLFIFGCPGTLLLHRLSPVVVSRGYSSLQCVGFSLEGLLLLQSTDSRGLGFQ